MKANPIAVVFAALGCGGIAAVAAFLVTPSAMMAFGYATYELDLHEIKGDTWAALSTVGAFGGSFTCGVLSLFIGASLGYFLTRQTD